MPALVHALIARVADPVCFLAMEQRMGGGDIGHVGGGADER